jgi:hypothetical protein
LADDAIGTVELDNADDVALADKMKHGRKQIISELRKLIVGQEQVIEEVLLTLFVGSWVCRASRRRFSSTPSPKSWI